MNLSRSSRVNPAVRRFLLPVFFLQCYLFSAALAQGYYKDIFLDGGVSIGYFTIPAIDSLHLSMEYLNTEDPVLQRRVLISNANDENGVLLYPDGEPRFRLLYTFGGSSTYHGYSLGEEGLQRIREFYFNGGSYSGSCAGSAIFSTGKDGQVMDVYYKIWPGFVHQFDNGHWLFLDHHIPQDSPLLRYRDFGDDFKIEKIRYGGGHYAIQDEHMPSNTEALLTYDCPEYELNHHISCWAYKASRQSGRGVVIGSHPEWCENDEGRKLIEAIFLYALDGTGDITLKGTLENGRARQMNKNTRENDPAFAKIGDKQYHHFLVSLPVPAVKMTISLDGEDGYPFNLYVNHNTCAYAGHALLSATQNGSDKTIVIAPVQAGDWYIGIECAATVEAAEAEFGYEYLDNLKVLNGLEYSIKAEWEIARSSPQEMVLYQNYPNPFNLQTGITFGLPDRTQVLIRIFNLQGELIDELVNDSRDSGYYQVLWNPSGHASGTYFIQMQAGGHVQTRKCLLLN